VLLLLPPSSSSHPPPHPSHQRGRADGSRDCSCPGGNTCRIAAIGIRGIRARRLLQDRLLPAPRLPPMRISLCAWSEVGSFPTFSSYRFILSLDAGAPKHITDKPGHPAELSRLSFPFAD
jgi:hypothetical protein